MGNKSRDKGNVFMRKIARQLREACPGLEARKGFQTRRGDDEPDVRTSGLGVWLECKHRDKVYPVKALEQAEQDAGSHGGGLIPIAITHQTSARETGATLRFSSLLELNGVSCDWAGTVPRETVVTMPWEGMLRVLAKRWSRR